MQTIKKANFLVFTLLLCACTSFAPANTDRFLPEAGKYSTYTYSVGSHIGTSYSMVTGWGTQVLPSLNVAPHPWGELIFNENGTYEFPNLKESGKWSYHGNGDLRFTGFLSASKTQSSVSRGYYIIVLDFTDEKGEKLNLKFQKKAEKPIPDLPNPNGVFKGQMIVSLQEGQTNYVNLEDGKMGASFEVPVNGVAAYSEKTVHLYKENKYDYGDVFPIVSVRNKDGKELYQFRGKGNNGEWWTISNYWYATLSPDDKYILLNGIRTKPIQSIFNNVTAEDLKDIPVFAIVDLEGNIQLQMERGNGWTATWTPDGQVIFPAMDLSISKLNVKTKQVTRLYKSPVSDAKMSPNGKSIALSENGHIYLLNADGSNKRSLTNEQGEVAFEVGKVADFCWSPDSQSLAFCLRDTLYYWVLLASLDGKSYYYLSDSQGDYLQPRNGTVSWVE